MKTTTAKSATLGYESKSKPSARLPHPLCSKCGTKMTQGLITIDQGAGSPPQGVGVWIEGEAKRGWLSILKLPKRNPRFEVVTFRCPTCGFLESYFPPD